MSRNQIGTSSWHWVHVCCSTVPGFPRTKANKTVISTMNKQYHRPWSTWSAVSVNSPGIRDYIHIVDLAKGHVAAINKLKTDCGCVVSILFAVLKMSCILYSVAITVNSLACRQVVNSSCMISLLNNNKFGTHWSLVCQFRMHQLKLCQLLYHNIYQEADVMSEYRNS